MWNFSGTLRAPKKSDYEPSFGMFQTNLLFSPEFPQNISEKFVGQLLVTPDCIGDFLGFITSDISDGKMISGNSLYKEKLNEQITHPKLTFHSHPVSEEIADGYFITSDGYVAENSTIVDKGIL